MSGLGDIFMGEGWNWLILFLNDCVLVCQGERALIE